MSDILKEWLIVHTFVTYHRIISSNKKLHVTYRISWQAMPVDNFLRNNDILSSYQVSSNVFQQVWTVGDKKQLIACQKGSQLYTNRKKIPHRKVIYDVYIPALHGCGQDVTILPCLVAMTPQRRHIAWFPGPISVIMVSMSRPMVSHLSMRLNRKLFMVWAWKEEPIRYKLYSVI